jgi:hypothetical protein
MTATTLEPVFQPSARVVLEPAPEPGARPSAPPARRRSPARPMPKACAGAAVPDVHGGRLTRRGRLVVTMAWLFMVAAAVFAFVGPWQGSGSAEAGGATATVRVAPGDTLWELAGEVAPSADLRDTVADIMALNGLDSAADIRAGDVLLVPARD